MINLDDFEAFSSLDREDMLAQIDSLPEQLQQAWDLGLSQPLPSWNGIRQVLISGMGGSAIGADLLSAYAEPFGKLPVLVYRDYGLPAWAKGPETLVIASSHSGNTEETLSTFEVAVNQGCRCLAVTTGGALAQAANQERVALWTFEHQGQPRAAVGFSFGLLMAALARLDLLPSPAEEIKSAVEAMRQQQSRLRAEIPVTSNPAKRLAGQLMDHWVTVIGSGCLAPVARRWKGQTSELAKAWAQFEFLPEADHNTLAGSQNPENLLTRCIVIFLRSASDHPRNRLRAELTQRSLMLEGIATDSVEAQGDTRLANVWTALHYGDYVAYYLAMLYDVDPTPVGALENFKAEMRAAGSSR
jgi:glucose/mannose-6-phosphate isomerase